MVIIMYDFVYEPFDFLNKFQIEREFKIFVIESENGLSFYYTESGVMFSSYISYEDIFEHMRIEHGAETIESAIALFKTMYFTDVTEPIDVKTDTNNDNTNDKPTINIHIAEKLKNVKFILYK